MKWDQGVKGSWARQRGQQEGGGGRGNVRSGNDGAATSEGSGSRDRDGMRDRWRVKCAGAKQDRQGGAWAQSL
jgi:hypothetical protein